MAIWQYAFQAVPEKNIQNELDELPTRLNSEVEGEWGNLVDASQFWETSTLKPSPIITVVDTLLPKETWSSSTDSTSWKGDTKNKEDNDCWLGYLDDRVTSFSFRVDMRDLKNLSSFLQPMLEICQNYELVLVAEGQKVVRPEMERIIPMLEESKAVSFVQNPKGFMEDFYKNSK